MPAGNTPGSVEGLLKAITRGTPSENSCETSAKIPHGIIAAKSTGIP